MGVSVGLAVGVGLFVGEAVGVAVCIGSSSTGSSVGVGDELGTTCVCLCEKYIYPKARSNTISIKTIIQGALALLFSGSWAFCSSSAIF